MSRFPLVPPEPEPVLRRVRRLQKFTASGTWTRPDGVEAVHARVQGAGQGGGRGTLTYTGPGGISGQLAQDWVAVNDDVIVTVGLGGMGTGNFGDNGGSSSFGALLTALGGNTAHRLNQAKRICIAV